MIDDNTIRDMFGSAICDFFFFFSPFFNSTSRKINPSIFRNADEMFKNRTTFFSTRSFDYFEPCNELRVIPWNYLGL